MTTYLSFIFSHSHQCLSISHSLYLCLSLSLPFSLSISPRSLSRSLPLSSCSVTLSLSNPLSLFTPGPSLCHNWHLHSGQAWAGLTADDEIWPSDLQYDCMCESLKPVPRMPPYSLQSALLLTRALWDLVKSSALDRGYGAIWEAILRLSGRVVEWELEQMGEKICYTAYLFLVYHTLSLSFIFRAVGLPQTCVELQFVYGMVVNIFAMI